MNTSKQTQNRGDGSSVASRGGLDEMARRKKEDGTLKDGRNLPIFIHSVVDDMTELSPNAMRVYMHLARRADKSGLAFPSYQSIGDHCFKTVYNNANVRRKHAMTAIVELIKVKLIQKEFRQNEHGQISNSYVLLDPVIPQSLASHSTSTPPGTVQAPPSDSTVTPPGTVEYQRAGTVQYPDPGTVQSPKDTPIEDTPLEGTPIGIVGAAPTPPFDPDWLDFLNALCWICYGHKETKALTKDQFGALTAEAKLMRDDGYGIDDLRRWMKEHWQQDWRWKKDKQRPRPDEVRSSIPVLRAGAEPGEERSSYSNLDDAPPPDEDPLPWRAAATRAKLAAQQQEAQP